MPNIKEARCAREAEAALSRFICDEQVCLEQDRAKRAQELAHERREEMEWSAVRKRREGPRSSPAAGFTLPTFSIVHSPRLPLLTSYRPQCDRHLKVKSKSNQDCRQPYCTYHRSRGQASLSYDDMWKKSPRSSLVI